LYAHLGARYHVMLDTGLWIPDNKECLFVLSSIEYQASSIASPQAMGENAPPLVGLRRSFARYADIYLLL